MIIIQKSKVSIKMMVTADQATRIFTHYLVHPA